MKLNYGEISNICRRLALLLHAGIGIADGVFLLAQEEQDESQTLLKEIGTQLDAGESLSAAMETSGAFPACVTGMVQMGERSGCLEEVLENLAQFYERRSRSSRRIKNALAYPAMVLALMLIVIGVLLVKVLPVFDDVYASLGGGLSGVAAMLLHLGQGLEKVMPLLFGLLALLVLAVLLYTYCAPLRNKVNGFWMAHFGDRGIHRGYNNAHFAGALAMGLGSALPLEEAVELSGKLLADIPDASARCQRCAALLRGGAQLHDAMEETGFLPVTESRMLAIGLRQGNGDRVCADIANRLMEQAEEALENKVAKVEPAMVLLASVLVGAILLSVMLPLMNIMAAIG